MTITIRPPEPGVIASATSPVKPPPAPFQQLYPRIYSKARGNTICNICRVKVDSLSDDHVPPRSCLTNLVLQLEPFEHRLRADRPKLQVSQSGVRFKTLCRDCNSLLGSSYDNEIARFCKAAWGCFSPVAGQPSTWSIWCKPDLVIRGVFGHLLAATTDDASTSHDDLMRPLVLNKHLPIGPELRVYYWLHAHRTIGILRSVAMPASRMGANRFGIFNILKFPPVGFLVTELESYEGLPCLNDRLLRPSAAGGDAEVRLDLAARPEDWPERVEGGNVLVGGRALQDGIVARPWKRPGR